jgi:hypothetical protein
MRGGGGCRPLLLIPYYGSEQRSHFRRVPVFRHEAIGLKVLFYELGVKFPGPERLGLNGPFTEAQGIGKAFQLILVNSAA